MNTMDGLVLLVAILMNFLVAVYLTDRIYTLFYKLFIQCNNCGAWVVRGKEIPIHPPGWGMCSACSDACAEELMCEIEGADEMMMIYYENN